MPLFVSVSVKVADCPVGSIFVALPTHEFAELLVTGLVQILKLCVTLPAFVTLKVTVPVGSADDFDSLNASSDGFAIVTVMTVTLEAEICCSFAESGTVQIG